MAISRRDFITSSLTIAAGSLVGNYSIADDAMIDLPVNWSNGLPPLFCTAYIDPTLPPQQGQERVVAKYPLALVPQDSRQAFRAWRDKVKSINPAIKLLAYQMVIEESTVPGPGHDIVRKVNKHDVWVTYPGGITPKITWDNKQYRIYDPRSTIWQNAFLEACEATYHNYPYDGLLLDNCTVYRVASLLPSVRAEMLAALNEVLLKLRARLPQAIIIGNTSEHFSALNGAVNENRPNDLPQEASQRDYIQPTFVLSQLIVDTATPDDSVIRKNLALALNNQCFFGVAAPTYQRAYWPPIFDSVVSAYANPSPVTQFNIQ